MPINRGPFNALVDDDGSNTVGSIWNKAAIQGVVLDPADAAYADRPGIAVFNSSGAVTSLPIPAGSGPLTVLMNSASLTTVHGIAAGITGQQLTLTTISGGQVDLVHASGSAAAGTKLANYATSAATSIAGGSGARGSATFVYDALTSPAVWRLIGHEQGARITAPFSAANYTAPSGSWVVEASDIQSVTYGLRGRTLLVQFGLAGTTISGTPAYLSILNGAWGGYTLPGGTYTTAGVNVASDSGAYAQSGNARVIGAFPDRVILYKPGETAWAATTNAAHVFGAIEFQVN